MIARTRNLLLKAVGSARGAGQEDDDVANFDDVGAVSTSKIPRFVV